MKDDTTKVEINKTTEDGTALKGAVLQLLDKDGKEVDAWTTDGKAHTLTAKLTAGATYTLHEVSAPAGYCVAADQTIVVGTDGKLQSFSMTDLTTKYLLPSTRSPAKRNWQEHLWNCTQRKEMPTAITYARAMPLRNGHLPTRHMRSSAN